MSQLFSCGPNRLIFFQLMLVILNEKNISLSSVQPNKMCPHENQHVTVGVIFVTHSQICVTSLHQGQLVSQSAHIYNIYFSKLNTTGRRKMKNNMFLWLLVIRLHPSIFVDHDIDCGVPTGDSFFGDELGFFPKKLFTHMKCQCKCQFVTLLLRHLMQYQQATNFLLFNFYSMRSRHWSWVHPWRESCFECFEVFWPKHS